MGKLAGVAFILLTWALYLLQFAAVIAGVEHWSGWNPVVCAIVAFIIVWAIPIPFIGSIAGIWGAYYAWHWSAIQAIALFVGPTLLIIGLQVLFMGAGVGAILFGTVWDKFKKKPQAEVVDQEGNHIGAVSSSPPEKSHFWRWIGIVALLAAVYYGTVAYKKPDPVYQYAKSASAPIAPKIDKPLLIGDHRIDPTSPVYAPMKRTSERMVKTPEFSDFAKRSKQTDGFSLGARLSIDGLQRLPTSTLERRAAIVQMILENGDIPTCALIAKGGDPSDKNAIYRIFTIMEKLPPDVIDEWFEITYDAALAELRQLPKTRIAEESVRQAYARSTSKVSAANKKLLVNAFGDASQQADKDACQAGRVLYAAVMKADPLDRGLLVRALVQ